MFPSLCSWWFSCERQGTSPTLKKHLKRPHPSQDLLATKGICHIKFFIFPSVKALIQLNFTWLLNWKAKRKNKNKTNLGVLWPSVTSTSPKENVSSFVVIPYLSASRVQSLYFLLSLLPRTPSWSMTHNRYYSINTCWMTERMLFNLSVPVFLYKKKAVGSSWTKPLRCHPGIWR